MHDRSEWEVFYAYPSLSAPALFEAAAQAAARLPEGRQGGAAEAFQDLSELARTLQVPIPGSRSTPIAFSHVVVNH